MKFNYGLLILILLQLSLAGCGDLIGKKLIDSSLESSRTRANCELNMDEISDILTKKITGTIDCLEKNLEIFIDMSELGRGEVLSRTSLINYLKRNRPDIKPKTFEVIDVIFALSHLITGEDKDFISRRHVNQIINLVRIFNIHAYRHYSRTFGSDQPATLAIHESHRKRVEDAATEIKAELDEIFVADRNGEIHFQDLMTLIKAFVDNDEDLAKIEGILFVKKIIAGGDTITINHKELGFIFSHLPKLLSLALDGIRYKYLLLEQKDTFQFIKEDVEDLANILFHPVRGDRRFEPMFEMDMAIDGMDRFIKDDKKKIGKYRVLIKEVKKILTKTRNEGFTPEEEEWVTGKDLEKMFSHIYNVTAKGLIFHKIYNTPKIKALLDLPQSVYLDPKIYELDFPLNKTELNEFCRIINTYRYMRGSFDIAYYSLDHKRNPNGPAEIATFEYLIKTTFGYYGSSLSMGDQQLRDIMKKFENELIEMNIILPRRSRNTAETIALLGSLFQAQSDDNKVLDVDEATEFAISLMTAMDAQKTLFKFYEQKVVEDASTCHLDEFDRINPECFNKYFYNGVCTHYRQYFPRLFEYLGISDEASCDANFNSEHNFNYLVASAKAARFCHQYPDDLSEIPYTEGDIMSILLAMMHIETTITRWDSNLNNFMDANEVMDAYSIYKPAINSMLPKLPSVLDTPKIRETLAKQVFLYLVKFEEVPKTQKGQDIWKLVKFLLSFNAKKAPAERKTIASILRIVSEEGKKKADAQGELSFDCNWLRDPDNIPRE